MGVIYKLLPEITSYIIEQKQNDPKATCKNLAGRVYLKFGHQVSKSSVHELLKRSGVIKPKEKKLKDSFKIPLEKKKEIFKAMQPFVAVEPKEQLIRSSVFKDAGEIFLKCALLDLSFKPILGINEISDEPSLDISQLKSEWEYLTQQIYAIKIEMADLKTFYLDGRLQGLYDKNPKQDSQATPIERAVAELTDSLINGTLPLIVGTVGSEESDLLNLFITAFKYNLNTTPHKISLLGIRDQVFAEFSWPQDQGRGFIIGISPNHHELQWVMEDQRIEIPWEMPIIGSQDKAQLKILKKGVEIVITNLISTSYDEIFEKYEKRPKVNNILTKIKYDLDSQDKNASQWLKNRLKERALMFFSSEFNVKNLEEIINLSGFEVTSSNSLALHLQVSKEFAYFVDLQKAIGKINDLSITDFAGKKIKIHIDE